MAAGQVCGQRRQVVGAGIGSWSEAGDAERTDCVRGPIGIRKRDEYEDEDKEKDTVCPPAYGMLALIGRASKRG